MIKTEHTRQDVVRMTGHLLLHHPTTGAFARAVDGFTENALAPGASCWCLHGAIYRCSVALKAKFERLPEGFWGMGHWDNATDVERRAYAESLTNYVEGEVLW